MGVGLGTGSGQHAAIVFVSAREPRLLLELVQAMGGLLVECSQIQVFLTEFDAHTDLDRGLRARLRGLARFSAGIRDRSQER